MKLLFNVIVITIHFLALSFCSVLHVSPIRYLGEHVKVRVGSIMPHEGGDVLDVVGAIRHPKFEEEPAPHADIALLKLARHLGKLVY